MTTNQISWRKPMLALTFVPLAIALNVGIGAIVKALNLPLYLDSIGTILATIMLGWRWGAVVGVLGFIITAIIINPLAVYFVGTQVAIAIFINVMAINGWFKNVFRTVVTGLLLGLVSAIVSAPVIIFVFGGATGNGSALVTSFFVKFGHQIVNSIFLSGFSIEPLDKCLQCLLAFFIIKRIPASILERFPSAALIQNKLIPK